MTSRYASILLLVFLVASPLAAENFVLNPSFDTDELSWVVPPALTLSHTAADGFVAPGAAEVEGVVVSPPFSSSTGIIQCVDLTGRDLAKPLFVQAALKPVNHDASEPAITVTYHDDTACNATLGQVDVFGIDPVQGQWSAVEGPIEMPPAGTLSARVIVRTFTSGDSDALTRFDDVFFGPNPAIFADGFESGDTTAWSSVQP